MNDLISKIPLIRFIIPVISGILIAYARLHICYAAGLCVLGVVVWGIAFFAGKKSINFKIKNLYTISLLCMVTAISWINTSLFMPQNIDFENYKYATVEIKDIKQKKRSVQLTCNLIELTGDIEIRKENAVVLIFTKNNNTVHEGDIVEIPANFKRIINRNYNDGFDYASFMESKGIIYSQFVMPYKMKVVGHRTTFVTVAGNIQKYLSDRISESSFISVPAKQFLITTLLGDSSYLDKDLRRSFSSVGLSHILAVSGLHVGIIFFLMTILLYPLRMYRKTRYTIIIVSLVIYAFITGLSPSVIRAVIMALFLLGAAMLYRRNSSINALFGSAVFILMFNPLDLFNVGFQLSYLSVIAILLMSGRMNPFQYDNKVAYYFASVISVSLAATIGTCALSAYYFKIFPVSFLVTNALIVPLLPFVFGLGIIYIFIPNQFVGTLFDSFYNLLILFIDFVNSIPFSSVDIEINKYQVLLYYLLLSLFILWWYLKKRIWLFSFFMVIAFTAIYYFYR